jgi:hypothetical protein
MACGFEDELAVGMKAGIVGLIIGALLLLIMDKGK